MKKKPIYSPKCHLLQSACSIGNITCSSKLGELTENIRTFAPPFENQAYTFNMYFEYDSWNRIQIITYPDGEKVSYDYNLGGMLERVTGDKDSEHNEYVHHIEYNPFEQKEAVFYGNGTSAYYKYDVLLRLSNLYSVCADGVMQDIDYTYDEVSNIGDIVNHAGMLTSGLGGTYGGDYTYDNLYRLTYADGNWHGNNTLYYETSIEYEKNGRISRKVLYADTWLDGNYATENYDNRYYYANSSQPNTLSTINEDQQSFEWDLKGNMVFHYNGHSGYNRSLCWDEQNRLLGVKDDEQRLSYYLYDANGDRTCKFTGEYAVQNQSGQWHYYYLLNSPTLYASPYLVTNKKGYTKHYYAESERIASRIGGGGLEDLHKGMEEYPELAIRLKEKSSNHFGKVMECLDADAMHEEDALIYLYEWQELVAEEAECYWYHPDHLGSSSWITYTDGSAVQHLHYLPWGEDFVNQRTSSFSSMYTFSAKEKDTETGYSYFGSRYYNSDLSIWLSVDPMAAKYASLSPYVYCADNPVKLVDPNGEEINPIYDCAGNFIANTKEGFTGEILIYSGNDDIDFSNMTKEEALMNNDIDTYDNQRINMTNDSKSNIWTHVASQFEGLHVYDEVFSMSSIKDEKIGFEENGNGSWVTNYRINSIRGTDRYSYESTVENLASSIIVHEWYSHRMKKNGDKMKSHRLAYKNVINYKYFWNKTTDNYKGFNVRKLRKYTMKETGRKNVDPPYRYSYKKYHMCNPQ